MWSHLLSVFRSLGWLCIGHMSTALYFFGRDLFLGQFSHSTGGKSWIVERNTTINFGRRGPGTESSLGCGVSVSKMEKLVRGVPRASFQLQHFSILWRGPLSCSSQSLLLPQVPARLGRRAQQAEGTSTVSGDRHCPLCSVSHPSL